MRMMTRNYRSILKNSVPVSEAVTPSSNVPVVPPTPVVPKKETKPAPKRGKKPQEKKGLLMKRYLFKLIQLII